MPYSRRLMHNEVAETATDVPIIILAASIWWGQSQLPRDVFSLTYIAPHRSPVNRVSVPDDRVDEVIERSETGPCDI